MREQQSGTGLEVVRIPRQQDPINNLGARAMVDTVTTEDSEKLALAERHFHPLQEGKTYLVGCGDDRDPHVDEAIFGDTEEFGGYVRYFGGAPGVAKTVLTTIAMQYGAEALDSYRPDFLAFTKETAERVKQASNGKLVLALHTADGNEEGAKTYNPNLKAGVGCAYAAGIGAVTSLNADPAIVALGKTEQAQTFGDSSKVDLIADANLAVGRRFFGEEMAKFSLGREAFNKLESPVMTLKGKHAPAAETFVVQNFSVDTVSNPTEANEAGKKFYDNDVVQIAAAIMKAFPELKLDPAILLPVMDQDIRATRAALVAHETGEADPSKLAVVNRGGANAAIAYLKSVQESL